MRTLLRTDVRRVYVVPRATVINARVISEAQALSCNEIMLDDLAIQPYVKIETHPIVESEESYVDRIAARVVL